MEEARPAGARADRRVALALPGAVAAALVLLAGAPATASPAPARPFVVAAGPRPAASDRPGRGLLRATFSPDGDGRDDRVLVTVRGTPGDRLVLDVRRASSSVHFAAASREVRRRVEALAWDGRGLDGTRQPAGAYVLRACSAVTRLCASTRVVVHLRILTAYVPRVTAVSVGETIPVVIASDRAGPYTIDLASAVDARGPGSGPLVVPRPGRFAYRVPDVPGGLRVLRVRNGDAVTYYPLVVHSSELPLLDPPPGSALVVYPYLTWRAYDRADLDRDGRVDSWYSHPLRPVVPLAGPFERFRPRSTIASREATAGAGQAFERWTSAHHLVAQHVTDVELGRLPAGVLRRYAMIVFPDHTEYYERRTYERLLAYRNGGGRLYFFAANSFYGEVAVERSRIVRLSYRYRTRARSDFRLAATGFRSCCWPRSIAPRYRLDAGVVERLPWLFEGTGLEDGDAFGLALREVDTVDPLLSPPGTIRVASATVPRFADSNEAAYAWIGTRPVAYQAGGARARRVDVAYARTGEGEVFSWGNSGFLESLRLKTLPARERADLDRVALNVWLHFTREGGAATR